MHLQKAAKLVKKIYSGTIQHNHCNYSHKLGSSVKSVRKTLLKKNTPTQIKHHVRIFNFFNITIFT